MNAYRNDESVPECPHCGSKKFIPDAAIEDSGEHAHQILHALVGYRDPEAFVFKEPLRLPLRASICCNCAAVDIWASPKVESLDDFWEKYQQLPEQD